MVKCLIKYFLETRLKSDSLEPLIDYPELLSQRLWPIKLNFDKNVKSMIFQNKANLSSTTTRQPIELKNGETLKPS